MKHDNRAIQANINSQKEANHKKWVSSFCKLTDEIWALYLACPVYAMVKQRYPVGQQLVKEAINKISCSLIPPALPGS